MTNNIFNTGSSEKEKQQFQTKVDSHSKALLHVTEKQKDLENSINLLTEKIDLIDYNSIKNFKKSFNDIKDIRSQLRDIKHELTSIKEFNDKVQKQLKLMTTKDEVTKLEKYIDLWNPLGFVTREEMEENNKKTIEELKKIIEGFIK